MLSNLVQVVIWSSLPQCTESVIPYSAKPWLEKTLANLANSNEFAQVLLCQIILQNFHKKCNHYCENIVQPYVGLTIVFGTMSILKYFCLVKEKLELPNPNGSLSRSMPSSAVSSVNAKVIDAFKKQASTGSWVKGSWVLPISLLQGSSVPSIAASHISLYMWYCCTQLWLKMWMPLVNLARACCNDQNE